MPSSPGPRAGDVWDLNFDSIVGREQGGFRPALVVSSNQFNETPHGLCIVAPLTGTIRGGIPSQVQIMAPEGGLTRSAVIMCEQARSVSVLRLRRRRGMVSPATLRLVQAVVTTFFDH